MKNLSSVMLIVLVTTYSSLVLGDSVSLFRVDIDGDRVIVEYEKDFDTCAHLKKVSTQELVHTPNFFCETDIRFQFGSTRREIRVRPGDVVALCHGNYSNTCSEEVTVTESSDSNEGKRVVHISQSIKNVTLSSLFRPLRDAAQFLVVIDEGVTVGSSNANLPALTTGKFPIGSTVTLLNNGRIIGAGGAGGSGGNGGSGRVPRLCGRDGGNGGNAIELKYPLQIKNEGSILGGGGGGGGSSSCNQNFGGGGGAGSGPGAAGAGFSSLNHRQELAFCGQDNGVRTGVAGTAGGEVGGVGGVSKDEFGGIRMNGGKGGNYGQSGTSGVNCIPGELTKGGSGGLAIKLNGHATNVLKGPYDSGDGAIRGSVDDGGSLEGRTLTVNTRMQNVNIHELFGRPTEVAEYTFSIGRSGLITSNLPNVAALTTGEFPSGSTVIIKNDGKIYGIGGAGGSGGNGGSGGTPNFCGRNGVRGGAAIELRVNTNVQNLPSRPFGKGIIGGGQIFGGGGGGAGASGCNVNAGGGGGQGYTGGLGGVGASSLSHEEELAFCGQDNNVRTGVAGNPGNYRGGGRGARTGSPIGGIMTQAGNGGLYGLPGGNSSGCGANNTSKGGGAGPSIVTHRFQLSGVIPGAYATGRGVIRGPVVEK